MAPNLSGILPYQAFASYNALNQLFSRPMMTMLLIQWSNLSTGQLFTPYFLKLLPHLAARIGRDTYKYLSLSLSPFLPTLSFSTYYHTHSSFSFSLVTSESPLPRIPDLVLKPEAFPSALALACLMISTIRLYKLSMSNDLLHCDLQHCPLA